MRKIAATRYMAGMDGICHFRRAVDQLSMTHTNGTLFKDFQPWNRLQNNSILEILVIVRAKERTWGLQSFACSLINSMISILCFFQNREIVQMA